jgi:large subunit ribosomal protein LP0
MSGGDTKAKKEAYFKRLLSLIETYSKILLVNADNVGSNHMQNIRIALRGKAIILMGKNTLIRKCMRNHLDRIPALENVLPFIWGNVGLVFTNDDPASIKAELVKNKVQAIAKAGALSPVDVTVPAGPTGQEPTKTSFFQALSIPTKIMKGTIEIINDVHLINKGEKVSPSQAVLLQMLGIKPFLYGLNVTAVYDNGVVYDAKLLEMTDEDLLKRFQQGVANVAALSLQIGYPTLASLPHSILNAYKNVLAVALETDYSFKGADKIKEMLANPDAFAAAHTETSSGSSATTSTKSKAPADDDDKKKGDDDDDVADMGGLFGGDDAGDDGGGSMGGLFGGGDEDD